MSKESLLSEDEIKKNVPKWVLSTGYTLLFLSVFINSIGLNLMQINGALTENVVSRLESSRLVTENKTKNNKNLREIKVNMDKLATKKDVAEIIERLKSLESVSHKPSSKKGR